MSGKVVNEMKYKKRKKFYHVLIPRMLTAWALAAILTACGIVGFYEYIADTFIGITQDSNLTGSRENQVRNLFKAGKWETNPGLVEIYVKLPSVIFEGIGMPDSMASLNVKQYAEIYDIEKDRALADSEMILSLICPTEDEEFGAMVYTSDFDKLESIPPFAEMGKKLNSADNSWDEWFGNKRRYFYAVETTDFYIRKEDHSFLPERGDRQGPAGNLQKARIQPVQTIGAKQESDQQVPNDGRKMNSFHQGTNQQTKQNDERDTEQHVRTSYKKS